MVRRLGEVLQTIGGYGFHDDGGARWITIRYETEDSCKKSQRSNREGDAISVKVHG
jgi:hypothetical protein